jgi:hypothetical protein
MIDSVFVVCVNVIAVEPSRLTTVFGAISLGNQLYQLAGKIALAT